MCLSIAPGRSGFVKKGKINWNNKMYAYFWSSIASQYIEDFTFIKLDDFFKKHGVKSVFIEKHHALWHETF